MQLRRTSRIVLIVRVRLRMLLVWKVVKMQTTSCGHKGHAIEEHIVLLYNNAHRISCTRRWSFQPHLVEA